MDTVIGIVLAAGKDERMNSNKTKLVHKIYGKEIIARVVETAKRAGIEDILTVVGYQKEEIQAVLKESVTYVNQDKMLGSGHAVIQAKEYLKNKKGKIVILNGDVPILRVKTIERLINQSIINNESATVLSAILNNPKGYGRIVRDEVGKLKAIIEENTLTKEQKKIQEINAGVYCFDIQELLHALEQMQNEEGIYNITDVIAIMEQKGLKVGAMIMEDNTEALEVNDKVQLEILTKILKLRINTEHMKNGVTIEDTDSTYIYDDVEIGKDTVIHPNTTIKSGVIIGENCEIGPNSYIREGCELANKVKIGSFVEIKKTIVGEGSKIPHLTYMGDTKIGKKCNIGCGTITCNYDGYHKSKTTIGDNVFIGSNVNLVAPITVADNAFIAAGSTITEDVPEYSLAIAREKQINKKDWNKKS